MNALIRDRDTVLGTHTLVVEIGDETRVKRILMKLDLRDRVQAVIFAYESGANRRDRLGLRISALNWGPSHGLRPQASSLPLAIAVH